MNHLCVDTSSMTSVAFVADGHVRARVRSADARHHVETIIPAVREVLSKAGVSVEIGACPVTHPPVSSERVSGRGIDAVLVGTGPAPFTGLRAGLVTARVLARTAGVPVWGISSLEVLARAALDRLPREVSVFAVSDARRRELYWGHFRAEGPDDVALIGQLEVGAPAQLANQMLGTGALLVTERGVPAHASDVLAGAPMGPTDLLDPAVMVRIVHARVARGAEDSLGTEPLYLRRPDIHGQAPERM